MIPRKITGLGGALGVSVLLLAGCGGGSTASAGAGASLPGGVSLPAAVDQAKSTLPDPCTLITRAQAEKAMAGPAAGPGKPADDLRERKCTYDAVESAGSAGSVTLTINNDPSILKSVVAAHVGGTSEQVSGLGDEAIYSPGLYILYVRKGNVAFLVQVVTTTTIQDTSSGKAAEVELATGVLAQI